MARIQNGGLRLRIGDKVNTSKGPRIVKPAPRKILKLSGRMLIIPINGGWTREDV